MSQKPKRLLTINGRTQTVEEWAKEVGLRPQVIYVRLSRDWPPELAVGKKAASHGGLRLPTARPPVAPTRQPADESYSERTRRVLAALDLMDASITRLNALVALLPEE